MPKQILVILGHPDSNSFCGKLADSYFRAALDAGHDVKIIKLGELSFDPILHHGYHEIQPLEPDLEAVKQAILWANHLVLVYPIWWGSIPALLKGMFDRIFLPGFAFKYRPNSMLWDKLLAGRSAHAFVTMDTPPWYYRWVYHMPAHYQMKKTILEFSGFKPVKISSFGSVKHASTEKQKNWIKQVMKAASI